jgi:catechol 2,3-dioxygenase-like lactoylglutathione lyase family enzyme
MTARALRVIPILRMFSIEKAREFYLDYLGCHLDWEHRFEPTAPLFMQVSRDGLVLHLTEHYGDGSPGTNFQVDFEGVIDLHAELSAKNYPYWRPGLATTFWGTPRLSLLDPFGNRLQLCEPQEAGAASKESHEPETPQE